MQHEKLTKSWFDIAKTIVFGFDSMKIVRMRIYILRMRMKAEENRISTSEKSSGLEKLAEQEPKEFRFPWGVVFEATREIDMLGAVSVCALRSRLLGGAGAGG